MRFFRSILFILVALIAGAGLESENEKIKLIVQPASTITVNGSTNINRFKCEVLRYAGRDTLSLEGVRGKGAHFTKGKVKIITGDFDCGMAAMTKDFRRTLKGEEYPQLVIEFLSFAQNPQFTSQEEQFKGNLRVQIAGVSRETDVLCGLSKDDQGFIHLRGSQNFAMSDFGLVPPKRLAGAIRVRNEIRVVFHLVMVREK